MVQIEAPAASVYDLFWLPSASLEKRSVVSGYVMIDELAKVGIDC
jgi:hypothetical protein